MEYGIGFLCGFVACLGLWFWRALNRGPLVYSMKDMQDLHNRHMESFGTMERAVEIYKELQQNRTND